MALATGETSPFVAGLLSSLMPVTRTCHWQSLECSCLNRASLEMWRHLPDVEPPTIPAAEAPPQQVRQQVVFLTQIIEKFPLVESSVVIVITVTALLERRSFKHGWCFAPSLAVQHSSVLALVQSQSSIDFQSGC